MLKPPGHIIIDAEHQTSPLVLDGKAVAMRVPAQRILAFDMLRGLCAFAVAGFHLLSWQQLVTLDAIGLYGVYVFFVLSGASITMAYARKLHTLADFGSFLAIRYLRLAPLYLAVLAAAMSYRLLAKGGDELMLKAMHLLPNITMLFGLGNPGASSLVIGGWSLGIEFAFYLLFPIFLLCAAIARGKPLLATSLLVLTLAIQQGFINNTLQFGTVAFGEHVFAYTQFSAFIAYFAGGCAIGLHLVSTPEKPWPAWVWIPAIGMLMLLFADHTTPQANMLTGEQGIGRALLTVALVLVWSRLPVGGMIRAFAGMLGDASYGIYLLHPVVFHLFLATRPAGQLIPSLSGTANTVMLTALVILTSVGLSLAFHRLVEVRVLNWGKGKFSFGGTAAMLVNGRESRPDGR